MLLLIRHGMTQENEHNILKGWLDVGLSPKGMTLASNVSQAVKGLPVVKLFSCDLARAVQTAQEVAETLHLTIFPSPLFRPWHYGHLTDKVDSGKTREEHLYYIDHPAEKIPDGQSLKTFLDTFLPAVRGLIAAKQLYAVVSHSRNVMALVGSAPSKGKETDISHFKVESPVKPGGVLLMRQDWTYDILNPTAERLDHPKRADKQAVLYVHKPNSHYLCRECRLWISDIDRCEVHRAFDVIRGVGTCGYWVKGKSQTSHTAHKPSGSLTPAESGYVEPSNGASCARCEYFLPDREDCQKVDPTSEGDDPGSIKAGACCAAFEEA